MATREDSGELKTVLVFFALALAVFALLWFVSNGSVFLSGIAAASVLAIGISRATAARSKPRR